MHSEGRHQGWGRQGASRALALSPGVEHAARGPALCWSTACLTRTSSNLDLPSAFGVPTEGAPRRTALQPAHLAAPPPPHPTHAPTHAPHFTPQTHTLPPPPAAILLCASPGGAARGRAALRALLRAHPEARDVLCRPCRQHLAPGGWAGWPVPSHPLRHPGPRPC